MHPVAHIAVENTTAGFDKPYTYAVPSELSDTALPGCRVSVPFGRGDRKRIGILLERSGAEDDGGLKAIAAVLDTPPLLGEEGLGLLRYLRETTFCTWFDALRLLVPAGIGVVSRIVYRAGACSGEAIAGAQREIWEYVKTRRAPVEEKKLCAFFSISPRDEALAELVRCGALQKEDGTRRKVADEKVCMVRAVEDRTPASATPKQRAVLDFLQENRHASLREVCYYAAVTRAVVDGLRKKGAVEYFEQAVLRNPYAGAAKETDSGAPPMLTDRQAAAYGELAVLLRQEKPKPALLYGVTGSGKTEVFLKLIETCLQTHRQALVMVPEISLTSQTVRLFHSRFGERVAVLHSGLSVGERADEWQRIRDGGADVVVGTRSAVFAPLSRLGLIVIDEEQEHTYHSEKSPRFHARDVALYRARLHGALLLLASATPSIESYHAARTGRYGLVTLEERYGKAVLPLVTVVDMGEAGNLSDTPSLSEPLREELYYNLTHGEQSILLLNRRGYSTVVKCSSCGNVAQCPHCSVAMTYHAANDRLLCHYCGYMQQKVLTCPGCGSKLVRYGGAGTQKLEQELRDALPEARVLRVDMDTTLSKFSHDRHFSAFAAHEYDIMIGTQMVAKGLNFPDVTLVGVLQADQSLYGGDYRSFERSFALLTQVVGRSGRGDRPGRALVQTYSPGNPVIRLAAEQDYPAFYRQEIRSRELHLYPPFCAMAGIGFVGERQERAQAAAEAFLARFKEMAAQQYPKLPIRLLGPTPADVVKAAGKYRYKLIVKCRNNRETRDLLRRVLDWFFGQYKDVHAFVDMHGDRF